MIFSSNPRKIIVLYVYAHIPPMDLVSASFRLVGFSGSNLQINTNFPLFHGHDFQKLPLLMIDFSVSFR